MAGVFFRALLGNNGGGGGGGGGGSGYSFSKTITIDHTKAGTADTTDYPLLFSATIAALKTVANGGSVVSATGSLPNDLAFFSDSGLTSMLDFEVESWSATTGAIVAWVRVPTLSHSVDTVIYLGYGNASVTSPQQNVGGTWEANFGGVFHLNDGTGTDSSGNGNTLTNPFGPVPVGTGLVGNGLVMAASTDYAGRFASSVGLDLTAAWTIEGWCKPTNFSAYRTIASKGGGSLRNYEIRVDVTTGFPTVVCTQGSNNFKVVTGASALSTSAFSHVVGTFDGTTLRLYVNGASVGTPLTAAGSSDSFGNFIVGTLDANNPFLGTIDEVRVSGLARSASYILATYNNVSSPSTFYAVT